MLAVLGELSLAAAQGRYIPFQIASRFHNFAPPPASPPALVGAPIDPSTCLMLYLSMKVKASPLFSQPLFFAVLSVANCSYALDIDRTPRLCIST